MSSEGPVESIMCWIFFFSRVDGGGTSAKSYQRIVGVGVGEEGTDGEEESADGEGRRPPSLQDIDADTSCCRMGSD